MGTESNGHEPPEQYQKIPPGEVINQLMARIGNLTMELALKDAYIAKLEAERAADQRIA